MTPDCESATSAALYSKFSHPDTIATSYTDAHNLLATTTNSYIFIQLLIQQVHPLLEIKNIAIVEITKYSEFNNFSGMLERLSSISIIMDLNSDRTLTTRSPIFFYLISTIRTILLQLRNVRWTSSTPRQSRPSISYQSLPAPSIN